MSLNNGETTSLKPSQLTWTKCDSQIIKTGTTVNLPVYLNADRKDVLFSVDIEVEQGLTQALAAQMGVCLTVA